MSVGKYFKARRNECSGRMNPRKRKAKKKADTRGLIERLGDEGAILMGGEGEEMSEAIREAWIRIGDAEEILDTLYDLLESIDVPEDPETAEKLENALGMASDLKTAIESANSDAMDLSDMLRGEDY